MRLTAIAEDKEDVLEDRSVCRELFDQGAQISCCFFSLFFTTSNSGTLYAQKTTHQAVTSDGSMMYT